MNKPLTITVALLLAAGVLAVPAAGMPGCSTQCCMHDTARVNGIVSFTAPSSPACCCGAPADSSPCNLRETPHTATGLLLPTAGGSGTQTQQDPGNTVIEIAAASLSHRPMTSETIDDLSKGNARLYLQLQSFLC